MERFVIYGLTEPNGGELRYIGKSTTGAAQRLASHLCPSSLKGRTHKENWVRSLIERGVTPEVFVIETCASKDALNEAERHHIAYFRGLGCRLTNGTPGGDGLGVPCSPERKAKISTAQLGVPKPKWTDERRAKPHHSLGRKRSPDAVAKTAAARRGMKHTAEQRARISAGMAASMTREHFIKISRAKGGRPILDHLGRRYETQAEAERTLGIDRSCIRAVLRGQRAATSGYGFTYAEDI